MPFNWKDAFDLILDMGQAIFAACEAGKTRDEAIRDAVAVAERRATIEADVADAMDGKR